MIKNKLLLPPVCVLVPMHNEERGIMETLQSLLNLDYPDFSIIVINDGSLFRACEKEGG